MSQQRAGNNHLIPFIWLDYKFFQVTAILNRKLAPISGRQHVCTAVVRSWRCGSFPDTSMSAVYLVRQLMLTMTATPANMQMTSVHLFLHGNHTNSSYLSLLQRIQNIHKVTSLQHPNGTLEHQNTSSISFRGPDKFSRISKSHPLSDSHADALWGQQWWSSRQDNDQTATPSIKYGWVQHVACVWRATVKTDCDAIINWENHRKTSADLSTNEIPSDSLLCRWEPIPPEH